MSSVARSTALRAGGACVRCRKGKTKCVYENGRAPCKNCAKGMHECYLPSESMAHHHGQSPARVRPRESLPSERQSSSSQANTTSSRHVTSSSEKLNPELLAECERVISKTLPSCVAFHKPSFLQQLKTTTLDPTIINGLLTTAARSSPSLIRRYGGQSGASAAAEHFAIKTSRMITENFDAPNLSDIQALCLLVIHEWGNRNAVRAYIYLGQAARMAQMFRIINAHQTTSMGDQFLQDESFRRVLWLIYVLDCFLTSSPGRHPALTVHDINDVALPCQDMNYHFGSPVSVRTLSGGPPRGADPNTPLGELGEFGHIVLATKAWRNVVEMLTTTSRETFSDETCQRLEAEIDHIRQGLPMHFSDKPGQINLHITMGSGFTYSMIHCLLHCANIFVNRRRLLQIVTTDGFSMDQWNSLYHGHHHIVESVLAASHSIISMLTALESGADKDSLLCFPIFMLFSAFIASSTTAYLSLKGLTPPNVVETAANIVREGLRFLSDGLEAWPLMAPWHRHLCVMSKILTSSETDSINGGGRDQSVRDDAGSLSGDNGEGMEVLDNDCQASGLLPEPSGRESEPPLRRTGFTTVNGGSVGASTPATASPPQIRVELPERPASAGATAVAQLALGTGGHASASSQPEMTPGELCIAFEGQLLELDDLAAFMGGGVRTGELFEASEGVRTMVLPVRRQ